MSAPENPPAFPTIGSVAYNSDWQTEHGMTLRDHFAGQAVPAIISMMASGNHSPKPGMSFVQSIAIDAFEIADALLAERAK